MKKHAGPLAIKAARHGLNIIFDGNVSKSSVKEINDAIHQQLVAFKISQPSEKVLSSVWLGNCGPNPKLDESFRGIERYLPTDMILTACQNSSLNLAKEEETGVYTLPESKRGIFNKNAKPRAIDLFCNKGKLAEQDCLYLLEIHKKLVDREPI